MRGLRCSIGLLLAAVWIAPLGAQEPAGTVRGRITDDVSQQPLRGANVAFAGRSAQTNTDGRYTLTGLPATTDTLRVTMIGYAPAARSVTVAAGEVVDLDLVLTAQALNLAEMVVVGYGEQAAGNITGAVTSISAQEFNKGRIVSPQELIQNKAAGVQVIENNEPGGGTSVRIRGATSINASSEPLYVIDGVPLGGGAGAGLLVELDRPNFTTPVPGSGIAKGRDPLNFINPDDIESITVLRDASAAAIYGANAASGVVLITTKSGRERPQFEYSGTFSASTATRYPSILNADQFRAAVEQYAPGNVDQLRSANTDWFDVVDRTGLGQEQNVALSGQGNTMDYRLSFNYLDQDGIIRGTHTQRVGIGVNYNQRLANDRITLRFNARGSRAEDQFTPLGVLSNAAQMGPTQPVHDGNAPGGYYDYTTGLTSPDNPAAIAFLARDQATTYRSVGNAQAEYSLPFLEGLKANVNLGYDVTEADREAFNPSILHRQTVTDHGQIIRTSPSQLNTVLESYLNYVTPGGFGPGILDLTGGYSYAKAHAEYPRLEAKGLSTDALGTDGIPGADIIQNSLDVQDSKLISFFGRANYNINDKYILALSLRRDGSSRFGEGNEWGNFPSVAVAWRLSQEPFLRNVGGLSDLKLRASWARTGNQAFGNYLQYSSYTVGDGQTQYPIGDTLITTIRPSAVDPNIKWESTRSVDIGLDFGFANNRFSGAIDWYDKRTTDLIFRVAVPAGTNLSNFITTNIGSMRNRGLELSLGARVLDGGDRGLSWQADFTAARNTNELLTIDPIAGAGQQILTGDVAGGVGTKIQVLTPGRPINSFNVYTHKLDANGKPIYSDQNGDGNINDDDLYIDQNGDGIVNQDDLRPFEDPAPDWILGHSSYMAWGKFDMGFTLRAYLGNYSYNNVSSNIGTYAEVARSSPYNLHTSVLETGFATPQYQSNYYVEDASFLRMDNITLGYSFDIRGQAARIFGTVQNAFTITGYSGVDPTAGLNGIDNNIYPRSRTFTSGLSLRF
ncbi:TonB-dependent receptor [soil metagenome]